jgi:hypothetical protein
MSDDRHLARKITTAFIRGTFNTEERGPPARVGWDALPEVAQASRLRSSGASDVAIRLFCTFTAAMDRARDAERLWSNSADLFLKEPWAFEPRQVVTREVSGLREILKSFGVSQRHGVDAESWLTIAKSLSEESVAPGIYRAIHEGVGDCAQLLSAARSMSPTGQPLFPLLRGQKISVMWVRMLVFPGGANVSNLAFLPVAVDVHVRRVSEALGLTHANGARLDDYIRHSIQEAWRADVQGGGALAPPNAPSILSDTGAALDPALWFVGKWGCSGCHSKHRKLRIADFCEACSFVG